MERMIDSDVLAAENEKRATALEQDYNTLGERLARQQRGSQATMQLQQHRQIRCLSPTHPERPSRSGLLVDVEAPCRW